MCSINFTARKSLNSHLNYKHNNERLFPCGFDGCKWTFKDKEGLERHKIVHDLEYSYDNIPLICKTDDYHPELRKCVI